MVSATLFPSPCEGGEVESGGKVFSTRYDARRKGNSFAVMAGSYRGAADVTVGAEAAVVAGRRFDVCRSDRARRQDRCRLRRFDQLGELVPVERLDGAAIVQRQQGGELAQVDMLRAQETAPAALPHGIVAGDRADLAEQALDS